MPGFFAGSGFPAEAGELCLLEEPLIGFSAGSAFLAEAGELSAAGASLPFPPVRRKLITCRPLAGRLAEKGLFHGMLLA